jgi:2-keto-4-pentenoate hydratase/2-oxohepta-3-ene-1,7-dioic acid hydratase in catechol pathway
MRIVSYAKSEGEPWRAGIQVDGTIVDAGKAAITAGMTVGDSLCSTRALLSLGVEKLAAVEVAASQSADSFDADAVVLGPPVWDPEKIICLGLNYRDHAEEAGLDPPSAPMFFAKYANSLSGPLAEIVTPKGTTQVDYEAELAVVIGRQAHEVTAEDALSYVAGAMAFNDVSARDLQLANPLWTGGKAIDTFGPCGPAMVTLDELGDLQQLAIRTRVNDELVQDGNSSSMIFGVAETIAFLSQIMTLSPGDVIATGTPAGVGMSRSPQLFLDPGDVVEVEIDQIGTLRNKVTI